MLTRNPNIGSKPEKYAPASFKLGGASSSQIIRLWLCRLEKLNSAALKRSAPRINSSLFAQWGALALGQCWCALGQGASWTWIVLCCSWILLRCTWRRMHEWRDASGGDFKIATPLNARYGGRAWKRWFENNKSYFWAMDTTQIL